MTRAEELRERRRRQRAARRRRRIAVLVGVAILAAAATVLAWLGARSPRAVAVATTTTRPRRVRRRPVRVHVVFRATKADLTARVPILMYHVIAPPPAGAPFPGLYVPAPQFAAQMNALAAAGFHAVTLDEVWRAWHGVGPLPPHPIVLTFDNGYRTQATAALPILRRLHWVGDENLQLAGLPPVQGGLTHAEVERLLAAGWELDTQGYSHADLPSLDERSLERQIELGKQLIERRFHVRPRWFCYPSGRYDAQVVDAVKAAGFIGSTTVVPGWASTTDDAYRLPRLRVLEGTTPSGLLAQIADARYAAPPPATY